jgi:hypothetical protein
MADPYYCERQPRASARDQAEIRTRRPRSTVDVGGGG